MKKPLLIELPDEHKDWLAEQKELTGKPMVRIIMDLIDEKRKRKPRRKKELPF